MINQSEVCVGVWMRIQLVGFWWVSDLVSAPVFHLYSLWWVYVSCDWLDLVIDLTMTGVLWLVRASSGRGFCHSGGQGRGFRHSGGHVCVISPRDGVCVCVCVCVSVCRGGGEFASLSCPSNDTNPLFKLFFGLFFCFFKCLVVKWLVLKTIDFPERFVVNGLIVKWLAWYDMALKWLTIKWLDVKWVPRECDWFRSYLAYLLFKKINYCCVTVTYVVITIISMTIGQFASKISNASSRYLNM